MPLGVPVRGAILSSSAPEWRNWQTRETQNLVHLTVSVGSIPSSGTLSPFTTQSAHSVFGFSPDSAGVPAAYDKSAGMASVTITMPVNCEACDRPVTLHVLPTAQRNQWMWRCPTLSCRAKNYVRLSGRLVDLRPDNA